MGPPDKRGNLFKELNVDLRQLSTLTDVSQHQSLVSVWAPFVKVMLSALGKMPHQTPGKFYRGRPEHYSDLRDIYGSGREVVWAAFTSVSSHFEAAAYLAGWERGCVLELNLHDVRDISRMSFYPQEREGVLVTNTRLVVGSDSRFEELLDANRDKHNVRVIPMQQIASAPRLVS